MCHNVVPANLPELDQQILLRETVSTKKPSMWPRLMVQSLDPA